MTRRAKSNSGDSSQGKSKYVSILEIKEGEKGDYIQFTKNPKVEITVNGQVVNGKSVYLNNPADKFERFVSSGNMTQDEADAAVERIPSYVLEEGVIKLD